MSNSTAESAYHSQSGAKKPYIGISMEGPLATWYAKTPGKDMAEPERAGA